MDANESFEQAAEAFYRATGHLMPGKDIAAAAYAGEEQEAERRAHYKTWCAALEYMRRPGGVLDEIRSQKDGAYAERNRLVAALEKAQLELATAKDAAAQNLTAYISAESGQRLYEKLCEEFRSALTTIAFPPPNIDPDFAINTARAVLKYRERAADGQEPGA